MSVGTASPAPVFPEPIFRLSVEQFHEMIQRGILTEDDPVELLEGMLVEKMPKQPAHSGVTRKARMNLEKIVPAGWFVDSQEPITTEDSEPEPDLAVIRGKAEDYMNNHPTPKDVGMIGEIAESSLTRDRGSKKRLYARANIPIYWIINLVDRKVEVYSAPGVAGNSADYAQRQDYAENDEIPLVLDGVEICRLVVSLLLP